MAFVSRQPGSRYRVSNCKRSVSGHAGILQPPLVLPTLAGDRPLHIWHDERADRAVFAAAPEAYMAMGVLARLHLLTLEEVAGRDIKPARTRLHQLIAGDRGAIHVAAAGWRIPGMRQRRDGGNQRCNNQQCRERPRYTRTAEQRDEFAPLHSITSSASASSVGGISTPNAFAVARLITRSNLVASSTGRSPGFSPVRIRPT